MNALRHSDARHLAPYLALCLALIACAWALGGCSAQTGSAPSGTSSSAQPVAGAEKDGALAGPVKSQSVTSLTISLQEGGAITIRQAKSDEISVDAQSASGVTSRLEDGVLHVTALSGGVANLFVPNGWAGATQVDGPGSLALERVIMSGELAVNGAASFSVNDSSAGKLVANDVKDVQLLGASGQEDLFVQADAPSMEAMTVASMNKVTLINTGGSINATAIGSPDTLVKTPVGNIFYTSNEDETTECVVVIDKDNPATPGQGRGQGGPGKGSGPGGGQGSSGGTGQCAGQRTVLEAPQGTVSVAYTGGTCPAGTESCPFPAPKG